MSKIIEWNGYNINRKYIGKGSFAKVYYGINIKTKQEVAIKKISYNGLTEKMKSKTLLEINILKNTDHPNIVKLYEYKFEENYLFLILEYCNNGDLFDWINKTKQCEETFNVIKQILEGMNYLHQNKIIHRDIKPQNILLHNSIIKICDFGFSQYFNNQLSLFRTVCGTPLYMSPEIINLQDYTIKSEIWSLGILFYNIFFNEHPYGELLSVVDYRNKLTNPANLKNINIFNDTYCNYIFNNIINSMLCINPNLRPTTETILNEILNCEPDETTPICFLNNDNNEEEFEILKLSTEQLFKVDSIKTSSFINSPCLAPTIKNVDFNDISLQNTIIIDDYFSNKQTADICSYINSFNIL